MFKFVVLLTVAAMAMANPGLVVPAVRSVSQYGSSVVHGSPVVYRAPAVYRAPVVYPSVYGASVYGPSVYGASVYGARAVVPVHHLHKRSLVSYSRPLVSAYSPIVSAYSPPVVSAYTAPAVGYPYSAVYPRALSVHPY